MSKAEINRESLARIATLVRPALAGHAYIPALTHIRFDRDYATAYNDIAAISVVADVDLAACVPGDLLIRALSSFSSESVLFQQDKSTLLISSGRAKIKLPTLDLDAFPFAEPKNMTEELVLDADIVKGIQRCLVSTSNDPTHPAQMGVTLDAEDGYAVLYSTDSSSISRAQTKTRLKLPANSPVILPTFLCEQVLALDKAFPGEEITLELYAGALQVRHGRFARVFSRTPVDVEPLDFPMIMAKNCDLGAINKLVAPIPDQFESALGRALLVLSDEQDKFCEVSGGDGRLRLRTTSSTGDADDSMAFDGNTQDLPVFLDPVLLARGSKLCARIGFLPRMAVMVDADQTFVHLVANSSK